MPLSSVFCHSIISVCLWIYKRRWQNAVTLRRLNDSHVQCALSGGELFMHTISGEVGELQSVNHYL